MRIEGDWLATPATQAVCDDARARAGTGPASSAAACATRFSAQPVTDIDISTDARPERSHAAGGGRRAQAGPDGDRARDDHRRRRRRPATRSRPSAATWRRMGGARSSPLPTDEREDARRRDFTMNALYADRHGTVVDPLGGLADLLAAAHPLHRRCGGADPRGLPAHPALLPLLTPGTAIPTRASTPRRSPPSRRMRPGSTALSRERVGHEMRKLLAAPDPAPASPPWRPRAFCARCCRAADARCSGAARPCMRTRRDSRRTRSAGSPALGGEDAGGGAAAVEGRRRAGWRLRGATGAEAGIAELGYRHGDGHGARRGAPARGLRLAPPLDPAVAE